MYQAKDFHKRLTRAFKNGTLYPPPTPEERAAAAAAAVATATAAVPVAVEEGKKSTGSDGPSAAHEGNAVTEGSEEDRTGSAVPAGAGPRGGIGTSETENEEPPADASAALASTGLRRRARGGAEQASGEVSSSSVQDGENAHGGDEGAVQVDAMGASRVSNGNAATRSGAEKTAAVSHPGRMPINIYDNGILQVRALRLNIYL